MPKVKDSEFVSFNDGTLDICSVKERKITKTKKHGIRFGNRTVGINRFWKAKLASSVIDAVVAIPLIGDISTMDLCIINGQQYKISQIQDKFDECPPCHLLSLEKNLLNYKDERNEN